MLTHCYEKVVHTSLALPVSAGYSETGCQYMLVIMLLEPTLRVQTHRVKPSALLLIECQGWIILGMMGSNTLCRAGQAREHHKDKEGHGRGEPGSV